MNIAESVIIDLTDNQTYNLQPGGKGSWTFVNNNNLSNTDELKKKKSENMKKYWTEEKRKNKSEEMKKYNKINGTDRYSVEIKKRYEDPVFLEKFINKMNIVNNDENKKNKASKKIKEKWKNDLDFQEKMKKRKPRGSNGTAMKEKWADPIWRNKMLESRKNKKEKNETN